ncbi:MAG: hypothetical protein ACE5EC_09855, partial [Phycisphaerae bacterium]
MLRCGLSIFFTLALPSLARASEPTRSAESRPLTDLIPADNLIVYTARPYGELVATTRPSGTETGQTGSPSSIAAILAILNVGGMIPDEGQVFADIASSLPLLGRFEHALTLLGATSKIVGRPGEIQGQPDRVSLRLKDLQAAVILRTRDQYPVVVESLNRIVGRYTNKDFARLTNEKIGPFEFQRLIDDRLPGWAIWEWGRLDDCYVVCFGTGAFEKITAVYRHQRPSLSEDPWYRTAASKTIRRRPLAQWFIGFDRLEQRLGEVAHDRSRRVLAALSAANITRDLWAVGLEGRALSWSRCFRRDGHNVTRHYSNPTDYAPHHLKIVPDDARHFAIIEVPTRWLVDNLPRAWLAGQSQHHVQKWSRIWKSLEQKTGINLSGNLIDHLGEHIVLFDYPPHPLDIPFALTVAIEIDDQKPVRMAVDALLQTWGRYLDERAERKGTTLMRIQVKQADDDVWFLQAAGILGPALKVTDRFLVLSWSPQALREAL